MEKLSFKTFPAEAALNGCPFAMVVGFNFCVGFDPQLKGFHRLFLFAVACGNQLFQGEGPVVGPAADADGRVFGGGEFRLNRFLDLMSDYDVDMVTRSGKIAVVKPRD